MTAASFSTNTLSTASHSLTASYGGDTNFNASSGTLSQVVNKADTTTGLSSSVNPSASGQTVTFTATVSVSSPGSTAIGPPSGSVTFKDGLLTLGIGALSTSNGVTAASFSTNTLSTASHSITASYGGDTNFNASSGSLSQMVTDTDLGLSGVPASFAVNATSPAGAVVTYTPPSAVDEAGDSPTATVSCTPTSGSTFALGATTVSCKAIDGDDTPSIVIKSFTVTVRPDIKLTLSIAPAIAITGTTVTASVSLTNTASVTRKVTVATTFSYISPSGQTYIFTTSSETFTMRAGQTIARSFNFVVTKNLPRGTYSITAIASDVTGSVNSTATFVVK